MPSSGEEETSERPTTDPGSSTEDLSTRGVSSPAKRKTDNDSFPGSTKRLRIAEESSSVHGESDSQVKNKSKKSFLFSSPSPFIRFPKLFEVIYLLNNSERLVFILFPPLFFFFVTGERVERSIGLVDRL